MTISKVKIIILSFHFSPCQADWVLGVLQRRNICPDMLRLVLHGLGTDGVVDAAHQSVHCHRRATVGRCDLADNVISIQLCYCRSTTYLGGSCDAAMAPTRMSLTSLYLLVYISP